MSGEGKEGKEPGRRKKGRTLVLQCGRLGRREKRGSVDKLEGKKKKERARKKHREKNPMAREGRRKRT